MPGCTSVDTGARCAEGHTTPTCAHTHVRAHAHARMRTLPWNLRAHSNTYMYSYVRRCMHVVIRVSWARACAAPDARAHAHTLAWNLRVHPYAHTCTHTYTYPHCESHLEVARSCRAAAPVARAHTHAHSCTSARTNAENAFYEHTQTYVRTRLHM